MPVLLGDASEDTIEEFPRLRPCRFGMREIITPEHVVHTDDVAESEAVVVLHELDEHVAAPVVTGKQAVSGLPRPDSRPLPIREVHLFEPVGDPRGLVLDGPDFQAWIALKDTGE